MARTMEEARQSAAMHASYARVQMFEMFNALTRMQKHERAVVLKAVAAGKADGIEKYLREYEEALIRSATYFQSERIDP